MKSTETVKKIQGLIEETLGTDWCVSDLDIYSSGIAMLSIGMRDNKQLANEDGTHPAIRGFEFCLSYDSDTIDGGSSLEMTVKDKRAFDILDDNMCKDYFIGVAMVLTNFRLKWKIVDVLKESVMKLKKNVA